MEEAGDQALGGCLWPLHSPTSRVWSSHFDEPPESDLSPAASSLTPLLMPVTPWVPGGSLAARSSQAGQEVRAGGGFPLLTLSLGQQARWGGELVPWYSWLSRQLQPACQSLGHRLTWNRSVAPCHPWPQKPSSQAFSSFASLPFLSSHL